MSINNNSIIVTINIPASVTNLSIGNDIWNMEAINVHSNNPNYSSVNGVLFNKNKTELILYPLQKTGEIYEIPEGVEKIKSYAFSHNEKIKELRMPHTLINITWYSIFNLKSLETIKITENTEKIEGNAIYYCSKLKNIEIDEKNSYYSSKDGVLFDKQGKTLIKYPDAKGVIYKIPEGTEKIENYAFNSANIKYLDIPQGLKTIGQNSPFGGGTFLKGIRIPDSVSNINSTAFEKSENLIIYCNSNSYAENYAIENNISIASWDDYNPELEIINIQFDDINLYNEIINGAIKHLDSENGTSKDMSKNILAKDDEKLTIQMSKEDVIYINEIYIPSADIQSLNGIEKFENIEEIWALDNKISDLSPISNLYKLKSIDFENNEISDISSLKNLTKLETIYLAFNYSIYNIDVIENLTNLKELDLTSDCITDISPLTNLKNLEQLYLGLNNISDIKNIGNLTNLNILVLSNNNIDDILELSQLTKLEELFLGKRTITPRHIITDNMPYITLGNKIKDISYLSQLTNLKILGIDCNNISDISAIKELDLENLYAESQELHAYIEATEMDLPKVFIDAKDENSLAYTGNNFKLINCDLNKDETKIIVNLANIDEEVSIEIVGGVLDKTKLTIIEKLQVNISEYEEKQENEIKLIKNIKPSSTVEDLLENIETNGTIELYKDTTNMTNLNEKISTGVTLKISLNNQKIEYTIVVTGDVDGDAQVDIRDILAINKHRLNKANLTAEYLQAADVDGDGAADIKDILQINKFRLGKTETL